MFSSLYCSIHHYLLRLYQIQFQSRTFLCNYLLIFYQISVFSEIVCWNTGCGAFGRHLHRCCTRRLRERAPDSRILRRKLREPSLDSRILRQKTRMGCRFSFLISGFYTNSLYSGDFPRILYFRSLFR